MVVLVGLRGEWTWVGNRIVRARTVHTYVRTVLRHTSSYVRYLLGRTSTVTWVLRQVVSTCLSKYRARLSRLSTLARRFLVVVVVHVVLLARGSWLVVRGS